MKEMDNTMIEVKAVSDQYKEAPVEAVLTEKGLIPGIVGREVDVNKSYLNMKRMGRFDESLLMYKDSFPKIRLEKNYKNYIISGNPKKNMVSLLFLVEKNTSQKEVEELLKVARVKKVKLTFFIDGYWFEKHNDSVTMIVTDGHDVGNLSYQQDYTDSSFIWMDTIMKKLTGKKFSYCYTEKDSPETLDMCAMYKNYTIKPSLIVKQNPYSTIKKEASAGSIISLSIGKETTGEFASMITQLQSKGLQITDLREHIQEKR